MRTANQYRLRPTEQQAIELDKWLSTRGQATVNTYKQSRKCWESWLSQ